MKSILTAAALIMLSALPASAFQTRASGTPALYTCSGKVMSRVSITAKVVPCCEGQLKCPQYLSTELLVKPRLVPRT